MKLTFLGTGTSQGVPVIGCKCAVCRSDDRRDRRLRTSAMIEVGDVRMVVDAGPDFRYQMLREGVARLDAILLTEEVSNVVYTTLREARVDSSVTCALVSVARESNL